MAITDSFFVGRKNRKGAARPATRKRMRQTHAQADASASAPAGARRHNDADIDSDPEQSLDDIDVDASDAHSDASGTSSDDDRVESAAQKRLRLAKRYLDKVREQVDEVQEGEIDAEALDQDLIAERLRDDALESAGRAFHKIAEKYAILDTISTTRTFQSRKAGQQLPLTGIAFAAPSTPSNAVSTHARPPMYIYSVSKDACIVKWDFWTGRKVYVWHGHLKPTKRLIAKRGKKSIQADGPGHNDAILAVSASSDGRYLVTGGLDKMINVWSVEDDRHLSTFKQHRAAISALKFQIGKNQLYSASYDRSVKVWNVDELSYIETLFGHQDQIASIDTLTRERCVTAGTRDRTVRLWKIPEESQLVFRAGGGLTISEDLVVMDDLVKRDKKREQQDAFAGGSVDVVAMLDEDHFLSGSDSGSISIWNVMKKKPLFTRLRAHGGGTRVLMNGADFETDTTTSSCSWITSIVVMPYTDLFASGSCDGYVKLWKVSESKRSFALLNAIPVAGFINSMVFFEAPVVSSTSTTTVLDSDGRVDTDVTGAVDTAGSFTTLSSTAARIHARDKTSLSRLSSSSRAASNRVLHLGIAVGQEHRLGRWWRDTSTRNQVVIIGLVPDSTI